MTRTAVRRAPQDADAYLGEAAEMSEWLDGHRALIETGDLTAGGLTHAEARRRRDIAVCMAIQTGATLEQCSAAIRSGAATAEACRIAGLNLLAAED